MTMGPIGYKLTCALLATGMAFGLVPGLAAWSGWDSPPAERCETGYGLAFADGRIAKACLDWGFVPPDAMGTLGTLTKVDKVECPDGTDGAILHVAGSNAGVCVKSETEQPELVGREEGGLTGSVDASSCEIEDREAKDPSIQQNGGGVAVCVFPLVDINPPPHEIDTKPCSEEAVDPAVRTAGGGASACARYSVR